MGEGQYVNDVGEGQGQRVAGGDAVQMGKASLLVPACQLGRDPRRLTPKRCATNAVTD